jgi:hypothetical protein
MASVFVLFHEHDDDAKLVGVYRTKEKAAAAKARAKKQPGFREHPKGFTIDEYSLDKDHWTEGFVST